MTGNNRDKTIEEMYRQSEGLLESVEDLEKEERRRQRREELDRLEERIDRIEEQLDRVEREQENLSDDLKYCIEDNRDIQKKTAGLAYDGQSLRRQ